MPLFAFAGSNNGSLMLHNDTTYILTAVIQASDGSFLGQVSLQPGQQRNFTTNLNNSGFVRPGTPNISLTPYRVIFQCPSKETYSSSNAVSPGSYVKASLCEGVHYCTPKEKETTEAPASTLKKK
jgi:hypothetical protein